MYYKLNITLIKFKEERTEEEIKIKVEEYNLELFKEYSKRKNK